MKHATWRTVGFCLASAMGTQAYANDACDAHGSLTIISATDDGLYEETHGPENTIDGNLDPDSRWSNEGQGEPKYLVLDLGAKQTLKSLGVAWYKGDSRKSTFAIEASVDGTNYTTIVPEGQSGGEILDFETLNFDPVQAQFVRLVGKGNEANEWNSIVEIQAGGCGVAVEKPAQPVLTKRVGTGLYGLDPTKAPGENFDLLGWYMTTPADDNGDGKSDSVYEKELAAGWTDPRFFYTDPVTGGMVFRVTPAGAKTSANTSYTRSELRGMLRRGNDKINTRGANKNNWVFSSAPLAAKASAAGVDGKMRATLSVNQVTRQGKAYQVGRVVIGQIHAKNDEPIRLYYRKLPQNKYGSLYFAHDPEIGKESWINVIGSRADRAPNPDDGIALDEIFTYEIEVTGVREGDETIPMLHLTITRDDGSQVSIEPFDMRDSGFSTDDEFMFFKAGAYAGNNTSPEPETDFDKVTFYELEYSHDAPPAGAWIDKLVAAEKAKKLALLTEVTPPNPAQAGVVIDDSFADGDRAGGADELGGVWWTTSAKTAIEIEPNKLGLVSGTAGRGIRTTFEPQTLSDGQAIKASFTFTTPETVGKDRQDAFRVGLHDRLERADLEQDLSASSSAPNKLYNALPGYMVTFDVNRADPTLNNVDVRKHVRIKEVGRLMSTYQGYELLAEGGESFTFEPNTTYNGDVIIEKTAAGLTISGTLNNEAGQMTTFTHTDEGSDVNNFGMLSFHVNSSTFGSSGTPEQADNGATFSNVKVEILGESSVEEASTGPVVFDDSFADGDRANGADAMDTNWWTTSSSSAIEVAEGHLGLVSGGSGRGIRGTFAPRTLEAGQTLKASFTFTVPETIGTNRDSSVRVGLFDKLGRPDLEDDLSASSKSPNPIYDGLPGYMIDFDVNLDDPSLANIDIRRHKDDTQGRLLGTTKGYAHLGGGGNAYQFEAGQSYTGTIALKKLDAGVEVAGSVSKDGAVLSEFSAVDAEGTMDTVGMLAFHVNSKTFGSSKKPDEADNGLDFTNIKVEVLE